MPEPVFDTMLADQVIHHRSYGRSLRDLAKEYLNQELDKTKQTSDWEAEQLSTDQLAYAAKDAAVLLPLYDTIMLKANELCLGDVIDLENRLVPAMCWPESSGVHFDQDRWDALVVNVKTSVDALTQELDGIVTAELGVDDMMGRKPHAVNWNSTAQVLRVLEDIGFEVADTRQETLESLTDRHTLIPKLLAYREGAKKLSAYGKKWAEHLHAGTGRIHADWRQIGAETGRMSCKSPNLQSLPRSKDYRACFRAAPGHVLIKADYAQIELRLIAEIAGDDAMKKAFIDGVDLHALTATHVNGGGAIEDVTTDDRQMAKAVNFGLIYGMGAPRLADYARSSYGVDMDEATASEVRASYFRAYPGLRRWQRLQGRLKETRTVLGRRRAFEGDGHYTGKLNSPVQGTGADGLKLAVIRLWETRDTVDAYPVLTVHDEIVVEAPADRAEQAKQWLIDCMIEGMAEVLKEVPVVVDAEVKEAWG